MIETEEEYKMEGGSGEWRPWRVCCHAVQRARAATDGRGEDQTEEEQVVAIATVQAGIDARVE